MSHSPSTAIAVEPSPEFRAAASKVCSSAAFRRSPRLRDLFSHILECSLEGRFDELSEIRIAETVFRRKDYNSTEGNIVRVSVRQLRTKLAEYYDEEGIADDLLIDIPKGAYVAVFRRREESTVRISSSAVVQRTPNSALVIALAAVSVLLLAAVIALWMQNRKLLAQVPAPPSPTLFDALYPSPSTPQRVEVVVTDSALVLYENLTGRTIPVEEYSSPRYMQEEPRLAFHLPTASNFVGFLRSRQISSLADFRTLAQIAQNPRYARDIRLRHARNINARDFDNDDSFFLIGSAYSNPWVSLFEGSLQFPRSMTFGKLCFENRHPQPGEQQLYCSEEQKDEGGTVYGRISLIHNGNRRGRVLIIGGTDMEGTEAAGNFLLNSQSIPQVLKVLKANSLKDLPDFDLLLKTRSVGGTGRAPQIAAVRRL